MIKTEFDYLRSKGCRKQQRLAAFLGGHVGLLHDASDLRLETHVQHPI